jgi:hypothetical protein
MNDRHLTAGAITGASHVAAATPVLHYWRSIGCGADPTVPLRSGVRRNGCAPRLQPRLPAPAICQPLASPWRPIRTRRNSQPLCGRTYPARKRDTGPYWGTFGSRPGSSPLVHRRSLAESEPPSHALQHVRRIRAAYEQRGELSAAVELRCRFPGIASTAQARECARIIASWKPLPKLPTARAHRRKVPRSAS